MRFATPSSLRTFTAYSLPVSGALWGHFTVLVDLTVRDDQAEFRVFDSGKYRTFAVRVKEETETSLYAYIQEKPEDLISFSDWQRFAIRGHSGQTVISPLLLLELEDGLRPTHLPPGLTTTLESYVVGGARRSNGADRQAGVWP
jgi:hypothetical protein